MDRVVAVAVLLLAAPMLAQAQWTWTPQTGRWVNIKKLPKETPELQMEYARSEMLKGNFKKALHETVKFQSYYKDNPLADQIQFLRGEIKLAQGDLVAAAKEFQQVVTKYPNTALYDKVIAKQYAIGDKLYEQGQAKLHKRFRLFRKKPLTKAIQVYSMVINNQPFTDAAAEAQYKVGLCHHTRKEYTEAAFEYRRVIEDYSTSKWVADALFGLAACYYDSSRAADYDQKPCQLAIDAMDDFKQRFPSDQRVADLDQKRTKMRETIAQQRLQTAQFYAKRRNFASARIYYEVVDNQFGETRCAEKARKWLAENPSAEPGPADRVLKGKQKAL
jgi:outer membrane assembly lipoprotein YfiO